MKSRRHSRKPTLALWMIVAVADAALLAAAAGPLVTTLVIAGLVIVAGTLVATRMAGRARPAGGLVLTRAALRGRAHPARPQRRKA